MKNILIAASIVGFATASVILYLSKRKAMATNAGNVVDAATDAYKAMNNHINSVEGRAQHAMG